MFGCITHLNATDVASFERVCHFHSPQSPTGGTSGLCFKKLNITTSNYKIIINRLDRKVPLFVLVNTLAKMSFSSINDRFYYLVEGDGELQTC